MNEELVLLQKIDESENLLLYLFNLPRSNYSISVKYLFFIIDYLELKRNYSVIQDKINKLNGDRRNKWKKTLLRLKQLEYFDKTITTADLEYIMYLSYSVRVTYFQTAELISYSKSEYTIMVTRLLKPYLSLKGLVIYENWLESLMVSK